MPIELIPWLAAAALTGAGAIVALIGGRRGHIGSLIATASGLAGVLVGIGWRAWVASAWPGHLPADALALLAAGALVVLFWARIRFNGAGDRGKGLPQVLSPEQPVTISALIARQRTPAGRDIVTGLTLFGVTALLAAAMLWAWRTPASTPTWAARAPLFGLHSLLAAAGLGGWLVVLAASLPWAIRVLRRRQAHGRPADDPGRVAALISFTWLTAALLVGMAWQLAARVAPWYIAAAALWQIVAWLLGASYLHITSSWRPMRSPAWLATVLAGLTCAAAILAALQTTSWLL